MFMLILKKNRTCNEILEYLNCAVTVVMGTILIDRHMLQLLHFNSYSIRLFCLNKKYCTIEFHILVIYENTFLLI